MRALLLAAALLTVAVPTASAQGDEDPYGFSRMWEGASPLLLEAPGTTERLLLQGEDAALGFAGWGAGTGMGGFENLVRQLPRPFCC